MPKVVTIVGNRRRKNFTGVALGLVSEALERGGATVETLLGADLDLAFPGEAEGRDQQRLCEIVASADAVVLATPEYHGSYSAFTKLIIESLGYPSALRGKPVALLGVAGGRLGAVKSLEQLRNTCAHTGAIVLPTAVSVANADRVFDEMGHCSDAGTTQALDALAKSVLDFLHEFVRPGQVLREMIAAGQQVPWSPRHSC